MYNLIDGALYFIGRSYKIEELSFRITPFVLVIFIIQKILSI